MSVVSVKARSFILALFIRDDGERFLLGDKGYDFKDSQLHFSANTIENDEVEIQGADGVLVAGQVRRASVQSFDGYVGDATTPKEIIEEMRREFIAFFAKGHHYRVVYIDCNRNAWQRKGGYLVDAPEVKELWQIHPEYHVGLNFEDVNYYEYDENAEGEEILSNIFSVPISSDVEGGLIWDGTGAVSEEAEFAYDTETASASGTSISISDAVSAPLASFSLKGNTEQDGTPTPDAPVPVKVVTGENTVNITGKNLYRTPATTTNNGITFTLNSDGTYDISGTATAQANDWAEMDSSIIENGATYTLSANQPIPSGGRVLAELYNGSTWVRHILGANAFLNSDRQSITAAIDTTGGNKVRFTLRVDNGTTQHISGLGIQLEKNSQATDFEPYQEQSYPISLGSTELCKIGSDADKLVKVGDKWYKRKAIKKITLDGTEAWQYPTSGTSNTFFQLTHANFLAKFTDDVRGSGSANNDLNLYRSPMFEDISGEDNIMEENVGIGNKNGWFRVSVPSTIATDVAAFKTWLGSNNVIVYYVLATPTDTEITNEALVGQLEAILAQGQTYAGTNNISTVIVAGNVRGELEVGYYTKYDAEVVGGGYVWEAGGEGGPTIVLIESIESVSPTWEVKGPNLNPTLENITTGERIEYVGMVAEGQTLTIDMGAQTASLNGLNVVGNIVGDWLTLAPGANTLIYGSSTTEASESEIGWSEIVG